jgi:hypothetical protein
MQNVTQCRHKEDASVVYECEVGPEEATVYLGEVEPGVRARLSLPIEAFLEHYEPVEDREEGLDE